MPSIYLIVELRNGKKVPRQVIDYNSKVDKLNRFLETGQWKDYEVVTEKMYEEFIQRIADSIS